jgi:hypothetical protein
MASSGPGVPSRAADRNPLDEVPSPALGKVLVPSNTSSALYYWEQGVYGKNGRPDIRFVACLLVFRRLVALRVSRQCPVQRLSARRGRAGRIVVSGQLCIGQQAVRRELGRLLKPSTPPLRETTTTTGRNSCTTEQSKPHAPTRRKLDRAPQSTPPATPLALGCSPTPPWRGCCTPSQGALRRLRDGGSAKKTSFPTPKQIEQHRARHLKPFFSASTS